MTAELAALVDRVTRLDAYLACAIGRHSDARWWTPEELGARDGSALEILADAYGGAWGLAGDRRTQASLILVDYSWCAFAPLIAGYLQTGSVPSLRGASVALNPTTRIGALALAPLPPRRARSVDVLREEVEEHMTPVVAAIADRRWLGRRTAWLGVGDRIVGAFEYLGGLVKDADGARSAAEQLLHAGGSVLASPRHRFATYRHLGAERTIGLRASCCRFYRTVGGERCLTCPLITDVQREPRVRRWISDELAQVPVTT